jgi:Phasin protein
VSKHQSERPAKPRRPMRRSMAELAASLQSATAETSPLERPLAMQQGSPATAPGENAGVAINTSLDNASLPLSFSSETAGHPREQEIETGTPQQGPQLLATAAAAQEYRAKAFKLMTANVRANLEYVLKLTRLTTPFEFIELSTTHATKQFELMMSQTAALGALSQSLTMANAQRMAAGVEKAFTSRKT